jgi:putative restriction endonuclease
MARHNKYDLLNQVVNAVVESGWNVLFLAGPDEHPFNLQIYRNDESYKLTVYVWHLTHGGGTARPHNEYRIQITGVDQFETSRATKTLILGWWQEIEVFAGFDVRKHSGKLGRSPSIQIREESLREAYLSGFSPCDKGNQEVAIAFRPDFFVEYVANLSSLHDFGRSTEDFALLSEVSQHPEINVEDIQIANQARRTTVVSVSKKLRDISFRKRVLTAYGNRCAVCGLQLKLVEAAHIIPVNHEASTDEIRNSLALCVLHHRSYDQALIAIDEDYYVLVSEAQADELRRLDLYGGLERFRRDLRPIILLPPTVSDRPHVEYIKLANYLRSWRP